MSVARRAAARRIALVVALSSLLGSLAAPPQAAAAEPLSTLVGGLDTTARWTAYKVESTGESYTLDWSFEMEKEPLQVGIMFYTGDDTWRGGFTYTAFVYRNEVRYEVNLVPGSPIKGEEMVEALGYTQTVRIAGPLPGSVEEPQVHKILIWSSGSLGKGVTWDLKAGPNARLLVDPESGAPISTTGSSAFLHMSKDFGGAANAGLQTTAPRVPGVVPNGIGPGARATARGIRTYDVQRALIGGFQGLGQGSPFQAQANAVMKVTAPNGFQQDCVTTNFHCAWYHLKPPLSLGPGRYQFELSGAGAGLGPFGDVILYGIDAELPE